MKEQKTWCEFFQAIENDPTKKIKGLTIRDMLEMSEHVSSCDNCFLRTERVLAKAPKNTFNDQLGMN